MPIAGGKFHPVRKLNPKPDKGLNMWSEHYPYEAASTNIGADASQRRSPRSVSNTRLPGLFEAEILAASHQHASVIENTDWPS